MVDKIITLVAVGKWDSVFVRWWDDGSSVQRWHEPRAAISGHKNVSQLCETRKTLLVQTAIMYKRCKLTNVFLPFCQTCIFATTKGRETVDVGLGGMSPSYLWKSCAGFPGIGLLWVENNLQSSDGLVQLTNKLVNWHPHAPTFPTHPPASRRSVKVRVGGEDDGIQTPTAESARS